MPEGRGVFGSLNVVENLVMAARAGTDGRKTWTLERIFELFPRLYERKDNGGLQLSGGEQQMLTIGRALMTNPDLILIDEATEGLAPMVAQDIWRTLEAIKAEGVAAIVVDRDFRSLSRIVDRTVLLSKGAVVFAGTPAELAAQPELLERYLGVCTSAGTRSACPGDTAVGTHWMPPKRDRFPMGQLRPLTAISASH